MTDRIAQRDALVSRILATLPDDWRSWHVLKRALQQRQARQSRGEDVGFMEVLEEWANRREGIPSD